MNDDRRTPLPGGRVSTIRGRWQAPVLGWVTRLLVVLGLVAVVVPGTAGEHVGRVVVAALVSVPLLRVVWLVWRWVQERDWRFVAVGSALLVVVGVGALLAALGVG